MKGYCSYSIYEGWIVGVSFVGIDLAERDGRGVSEEGAWLWG